MSARWAFFYGVLVGLILGQILGMVGRALAQDSNFDRLMGQVDAFEAQAFEVASQDYLKCQQQGANDCFNKAKRFVESAKYVAELWREDLRRKYANQPGKN